MTFEICMENKTEITLKCDHSFCEKCIVSWSLRDKTCPLCRGGLDTKKEVWMITRTPSKEERFQIIINYIENVI